MNNGSPIADATVPPAGTEQAADHVARQQQPPPPAESKDTVSSVVEGIAVVAEIVFTILD